MCRAPKDVLRAAAHALRPRGVLGITVPNLDSWSFQKFRGHWLGLDVPRHLTHFTPATLCSMVEAAGFRILLVEQVGRDGWIPQDGPPGGKRSEHASPIACFPLESACRSRSAVERVDGGS